MTDSVKKDTTEHAPEEQPEHDQGSTPRPFSNSAFEELSSLPTDNQPYRAWWVLDPNSR